jgi:hypothetical protein
VIKQTSEVITQQEVRKEVSEVKARNPKKEERPKSSKITDELLDRALNGRSNTSEIKGLVERISKGQILTKENRAIELVEHNTGALNRVIKEAGLKGKVKVKSVKKGENKPSMIWRIA